MLDYRRVPTFAIKISQMFINIPYMDPMGKELQPIPPSKFLISSSYLGGGSNNPFENMLLEMDSFPRDRDENKKYLKPPASYAVVD